MLSALVQLQHSQPRHPPSHTPFSSSTRNSGFPFFQWKALHPSRCAWDRGSLNGCEQHTTNMQTKCVEGMLTGYLLTGFSFLKPPAACTHTHACPFPILSSINSMYSSAIFKPKDYSRCELHNRSSKAIIIIARECSWLQK